MRDLEIYATDEAVAETFKNTNFGSASPRQTIADTLLKVASGYGTGKTSLGCCEALGLVKRDKRSSRPGGKYTLTTNGGRYLYDLFENAVQEIK